jgi:hypothetical protein
MSQVLAGSSPRLLARLFLDILSGENSGVKKAGLSVCGKRMIFAEGKGRTYFRA